MGFVDGFLDSPISSCEVRYAGVAVGRSTQVKDWTATGAFIGFAEPLPSGTAIELRGENLAQAARVDDVIESADPNVAGMRVSFVASSAAAPTPSAPPPVTAAPSGDASPVDSGAASPPAQQQQQGGGKRKRRR